MSNADYYGYTDILLKYLVEEIRDMYAPLRTILNVDEVNLLQQKDEISEKVYVLIRRTFLIMARYYYKRFYRGEVYPINFYKAMIGLEPVTQQDIDLASLDEEWVDELLESVDPTSKVSFRNEFERKNSMLYEALLVSSSPASEVDTMVKRLMLMLNTYGIEVTDEAVLQAYEDRGVTKVKWNAEMDNKTCGVCEERNGKVYEISELPPKPHFNCRCWYTSVR